MLDLQTALDKITAIALGTNAEVKAEVAAMKVAIAEAVATIATNDADDAVTKTAVANLETITTALLDKLSASTPPV